MKVLQYFQQSFVVALGLFSLFGCAPSTQSISSVATVQTPVISVQKYSALQQQIRLSQGVWVREGYGEVIEITESGIRFLQFNPVGCLHSTSLLARYLPLKEGVLPIQQVDDAIEKVAVDDKQQLLTIRAKAATKFYDHHYKRVANLPKACLDGLDYSRSPITVFEYFWHHFNEYYAFFDIRHVDWQQQYERYRPQVTSETTDAELFDIFSQMVAPLQDAHVNIEASDVWFSKERNSLFYQYIQDLELQLEQEGQSEEYVQAVLDKEYWTYLVMQPSDYLMKAERHIVRDFSGDALVVWGRMPNNIGLLKIMQVEGFATEDATPEDEVAATHKLMKHIMSSLADTQSIIIDLRYNTGGYDPVSIAIASYFSGEERVVYKKRADNNAAQTPWINITLASTPNPYLKPTFVVTSKDTVSGAETLTLALKSLPHVQHIGQETQGALSDMLPATLPNNWLITLSNEAYVDTQGELYEQRGIPPDVTLPLFKQDNVKRPLLPLDYINSQLNN